MKKRRMLCFLVIISSIVLPISIVCVGFEGLTKDSGIINYPTKQIVGKDFQTDAETYLIFILANQGLENESDELLKAMAVVCRTKLWYELSKNQIYRDNSYKDLTIDKNYKRYKQAVADTCMEVMTRKGALFMPKWYEIGKEDYLEPGYATIIYSKKR
ncbi:hypothetical protein P261_00757 [Lachnospiraceae bacterium TWA4]|nr:hypothetical protein P261_00757 [Lachnospiraceae bacterium TWA4]